MTKLMRVIPRNHYYEAAQFPADEAGQNVVERFSGGSIKGTRLPPERRELEVVNNGGWRVQHAKCAIKNRGTPDSARQKLNEAARKRQRRG